MTVRVAVLRFAVFGFLGLVSVGLLAGGAAPAPDAPHLVVVSIDTTRADAISAYGAPPGLVQARAPWTPVIDELAAEGARFDAFYAHAPTTLNSHASMFTGLDPHGHAVPRNGFPLDPATTTLAERLGEAGWDTIGVVGARALEAAMGIGAGFRVWDDAAPVKKGLMYQDDAAGVVDRALAAVAQRDRARPLFLFVHFYDPHAPYDPPAAHAKRLDPDYAGAVTGAGAHLRDLRDAQKRGTADPRDIDHVTAMYLGEVAYVDEQLGRLIAGLRADGLLDRAVLVVTSDHGEVLSESPAHAWTHGVWLSEGAQRVPLVIRGFGVPLAERAVVRRQAEMAGLAPTLEQALGLQPTLGSRAPFWDLIRPGPVADDEGWPDRPVRTVFLEATRPRELERVTAWNNLYFRRGVLAGGFAGWLPLERSQGLQLEGPEQGEPLRETLRALLWRWDAAAPPYREEALSDSTHRALEALGYIE